MESVRSVPQDGAPEAHEMVPLKLPTQIDFIHDENDPKYQQNER